nr:MAG TPA: hypothetical protein [Caudoviricetes sp.]
MSFLKVRIDLSNLKSTALVRLHFIAELSRLFIFPLYGYRFGFIFLLLNFFVINQATSFCLYTVTV